jgi:hypothetical protein
MSSITPDEIDEHRLRELWHKGILSDSTYAYFLHLKTSLLTQQNQKRNPRDIAGTIDRR